MPAGTRGGGGSAPLPITKRGRTLNGSVTVYLVLTLAAVLTLYLVLIDGAKLGAARMQMESVSRTAENAVLAEFHRELHSRYDLFMIDSSYGGAGGGEKVVEQHLRDYMERSCERKTVLPLGSIRDWTSMKITGAEVPEARYACDNAGSAVREQVYAYMSADPAGGAIARVLVTADRWRGLEISGREWETRTQESAEEVKQALKERREAQRRENEEKEENEEEVTDEEQKAASEEPSEAEDMVDQIASFQFLPVLMQVFGSTESLSDREIRTENSLCGRKVHLGTGMKASDSHNYPKADEILFDRYIYEKTGNCVRPSEDGQLRYQTEYILCGKDTDKGNLEAVAERLLLIREGANCLYLFADEGRMGQVHAVAAVVSLILLNPELEDTLANALALAWSYLESVQDVRSLLAGYKVPLQKTGESWQTALYELLAPGEAIRDRGGDTGFGYEEYLQGLLFLEGSTIKTKRTMDIMEMDVREITHNKSFQLDRCLDTIRIEAQASSLGVQYSYAGTAGYN